MDANGDGVSEIFAELVVPYTSGTGGDTGLLFAQEKDEFTLLQRFTLIRNPLIISYDTTNGWHDKMSSCGRRIFTVRLLGGVRS